MLCVFFLLRVKHFNITKGKQFYSYSFIRACFVNKKQKDKQRLTIAFSSVVFISTIHQNLPGRMLFQSFGQHR